MPAAYNTVTEPAWAPTRSCTSVIYKILAGDPATEPGEIENFSLICRKVRKAGGYAVVLAELLVIHIWISTLNRAGLKVIPYPYASLYYSDTLPKSHIPVFQTI